MRGKILELLKPDAIKKLFKENPYLYILLINLAAILFILIPEYIPQETKDLLLRIFLLVAFLSLLNIWIKNTIFTFFRNLQVSIFIFIFFILLAQLLYVVFPSIYPRYIANFVESSVTKEMKSKAVEYLDQSPFAKPKANVLIRVPGEYGNEYDFEYEWVTDNRGYKNNLKLSKRNQFDVIALGDSFTEGLGVKTDNTWVSKLNSLGINAYSLGVQGYAPSQMNGTFKLYGLKLKPRLVIIGYLTGAYDREGLLLGDEKEIAKSRNLPSAIGRLVQHDISGGSEERVQFKFVISAALFFVWKNINRTIELYKYSTDPVYSKDTRFMSEKLMIADKMISIGKMQRYKKEMEDAFNTILSKNKLEENQEWKKTISSFEEISKKAKTERAKVMLLVFHNRGEIYLNKATGRNPGEKNQAIVETKLLKEFASENDLFFLDTGGTFKDYVKKIDDKTDISQYPY